MEHSSLSSALMDEKFELQPTFFRQTKAVLKKNMLVLKHRTQDMVSIILVPIYLFGLLAVIRMGLQNAEIEGDLDKPINLIQTHFPKFFAGPNVVAFAPCQEALGREKKKRTQQRKNRSKALKQGGGVARDCHWIESTILTYQTHVLSPRD